MPVRGVWGLNVRKQARFVHKFVNIDIPVVVHVCQGKHKHNSHSIGLCPPHPPLTRELYDGSRHTNYNTGMLHAFTPT